MFGDSCLRFHRHEYGDVCETIITKFVMKTRSIKFKTYNRSRRVRAIVFLPENTRDFHKHLIIYSSRTTVIRQR